MSKLTALLIIWAITRAPFAECSDYDILRLQVSDLLPEHLSADMHVDLAGFLWLSAGRRIYRYDGYALAKVYDGGRDPNPGSLSSTRKLFAGGPDGSIWLIDGRRMLNKYSPEKKVFEKVEAIYSKGNVPFTIYSIVHDNSSTLWMLLDNGNIGLFDTQDGLLDGIINSSRYLNKGDQLTSLELGGNGKAWALSPKGVLLTCHQLSSNCESIKLGNLFTEEKSVHFYEIRSLGDNTLVVSTESQGALKVELNSLSVDRLAFRTSTKGSKSMINHIWALNVTPSGDLWVSTSEGLFGPGKKTKELVEYASSDSDRAQLRVHKFEQLQEDEFLAQTPGEIHLVRKKRFESFTAANGLAGPITTSFAQSENGDVYIGSVQGMSSLHPGSSQAKPIWATFPNVDLIDQRVMTLMAADGGIWFGGYTGGMRYLDLASGVVRIPTDQASSLSSLSSIDKFERGLLLLGTPDRGVNIATKSGRVVANFPGEHGPMLPNDFFVLSMLRTNDGAILVGTDRGLIDLTVDVNSALISTRSDGYQLAGEEIYDIFESSDGNIWVGTYQDGIYRSSKGNSEGTLKLAKVSTSPDLPDDTINAIQEDHLGMLWLSTNKGLIRLDPDSNTITVFSMSDGLVDEEFIAGASFRDADGYLYFGSTNGFNRFDPRKFVERRTPPPLRLTDIMIHREPVPYDPAYVDIPELVLTHEDHSLDVEFSTMDIISPGKSRYKYMLENFDDDWVDIGTRNSATFTSLPAGKYVLRVIGADSKGVWNYDGVALPVRVLPAPWLTWWAFTFYALALLGFVALVKRSYDTYLQKVAATREAEQMKVTATLAMDDLQDQLEVENRLVDNLRKHANSAFDMVDEFLTMELEELYGEEIEESLGRARQRLHCLKALEASVYFQGDQLKVNFRDAVDRSYAAVIKAYPHPGAELVLANDCSERLVPIDVAAPLLLLTHELMLNSVIHAFPESIGVECIEVKFELGTSGYVFELLDSGCGLPNAIDPAWPTTLGMELIARIAHRLNATIEVDRGRGTHYRVTVPNAAA